MIEYTKIISQLGSLMLKVTIKVTVKFIIVTEKMKKSYNSNRRYK